MTVKYGTVQERRVHPVLASFVVLGFCFVLSGCGGGALQVTNDAPPRPSLEARKRTLEKEIAVLRDAPVEADETGVRAGYQDFLTRHAEADPRLRAPALKRLGDMSMKAAHDRFLSDMQAYDLNPAGPPPVVDYSVAIEAYTGLLQNHPDYAENDHTLYALARAYDEMGEKAQALPLMAQLIEAYPESPHALEAYFRLGEYHFDRGDFEQAAAAYAKAASWEDPFFQEKAAYKLAWSYFNLKDYRRAVVQFLSVVDRKTAKMAVFAPEEGSLVWESLTYVATAFRRLGGPEEMTVFFEQHGHRRYEKNLYLMMGNHYMVEDARERGIETYRAFTSAHPLDPMAPFFTSYILEARRKSGDDAGAEAARVKLVENYTGQSPWRQANDAAAWERVQPLIQSELHRLALDAHAKAQQGGEARDYREAARWYRLFLSEFKAADEARRIQFLLGEALMPLNAYAEAGTAFEKAAYGFAKNDPDQQAAYAAVVAYDKIKNTGGALFFIAASKQYAQHFSKNVQAPIVLFNAAAFMFAKDRFSEAAEMFKTHLSRYPGHRTAAGGRKLLAHSYLKTGDFKQARQAYASALAALSAAKPSKTKEQEEDELSALLATAIYKEAEVQKNSGKDEEAAVLFQEVTRDAPASDLAPEALFEAALLYEKLSLPHEAIRVYLKLARDYSASELSQKAAIQAGLLYERIGEPLRASALFVQAAKSTKDSVRAQELLWRAGLHYEKAKVVEKVIATFLMFIQRFPKHADAQEALFKMAEARRGQDRAKAAIKLYDAVIQRGSKTVFASKSRFYKAEFAFGRLKAINLKKRAAQKFKAKTRALKETVRLYTAAVESAQAEIVTVSAFRLGEVFEHFQSALLHAERPQNLNAEQMEEYRFQLEEKAYPFEEKAVKAYESNVGRVRLTGELYDVWVKKSFERLAVLRPARYRRIERAEQVVSHFDPVSFSTLLSLKSKTDRVAQTQ
ncbi:MAG: tetratricopeptide repeat protein [Nitrospiria bacterium]